MAKKKKSKSSKQTSSLSAITHATDHSGITVEVFNALWEDFANDDSLSNKKLVGSIDQGTSSTRFLVFTSTGRIAASAQMEHEHIFPLNKAGWHELDPMVLWHNTVACITAVCKNIKECNIELGPDSLAAIGITNQRETTIAWNKTTGKPYYNAIVWDDTRTADIAQKIADDTETAQQITDTTGLPISSYFAGTKVKWLLDNVESLRQDVTDNPDSVCFGTVDSWLLYNLTGHMPKSENTGRKLKGSTVNIGGCFKTDVTNASRWLFMDLKSCTWNEDCIKAVCAPHSLPVAVLPEICPSSQDKFGEIASGCGLPAALTGVPLTAILGDQQSALFGQAAFAAGEAKNTYGTGLFLMMNTGTTAVQSTHGLLTTVAYQIGKDGPVHYALEGSVSHSGSTIQWLRDQLNIIEKASDSEVLARTVVSTDDLYFVPAFCGLFAPHWRADARGCIVGLTASHHKGHICRAALEAAAYQTKEVFDAIVKDTAQSGTGLKSLNVDGGGTNNKLLMQFQADIINVPVVKPKVMETTAMGGAIAAGLAVGVWKDLDEVKSLWAVAETYEPKMSDKERAKKVEGWNKAVSKSLGWVSDEGLDNGEKFAEVSDAAKVLEVPPAAMEGHSQLATQQEPKLLVVEEEKKSPDSTAVELNSDSKLKQEDEDDDSEVAHIGDVHEVNVTSRESILVKETANGFSTATLALTASAALGIGVLLGSSARKRS